MKQWITAAIAFAVGVGVVALLHAALNQRNHSSRFGPQRSKSRESVHSDSESPGKIIDSATYVAVAESAEGEPPVDLQVDLIGNDDHWTVRYPGEQPAATPALPATDAADSELHVPVYSKIRLALTSRDYVYLMRLPQIHKSQIAIPGRSLTLDFQPTHEGIFTIVGDHICGPPKPTLSVTVEVQSPEEYEQWRSQREKIHQP